MSDEKKRPGKKSGDRAELEQLLDLLRRNGVQSFKSGEIEVTFSGQAYLENPVMDNRMPLDAQASSKRKKSQAEQDEDDLFYSAK